MLTPDAEIAVDRVSICRLNIITFSSSSLNCRNNISADLFFIGTYLSIILAATDKVRNQSTQMLGL